MTAALAAAGLLAATPAFADPQVLQFGQMAEISSNGGTIDYTVSNLQPSGHNDGVWYSDVTAKGVSGNAVPNIADFNARAVNSSTFAVMKGNQTDGLPEGLCPWAPRHRTPLLRRAQRHEPRQRRLPGRRRHGQGGLEELAGRVNA